MIIELSVSNFRSIKDEQTFSLYTTTAGAHLPENVSASKSAGGIFPLKCAGIYGANASGKSNLLRAFRALQYIVSQSGSLKDGAAISFYEPYLLSKATRSAPVRFEIEFQHHDQNRYRYGVAFLQNKITWERLSVYRSARETVLFERKESDTWETIQLKSQLKGGVRKFPFFANNAYLSKAGNSADAPEMIQNVFKYLTAKILHLGFSDTPAPEFHFDDKDMLNRVAQFLSLVDTGVTSVKMQKKKFDDDDDDFEIPSDIPDEAHVVYLNTKSQLFFFGHKTDTEEIAMFKRSAESAGTRKLFELAPLIISTLADGGVLIMDELDRSMHPQMAEMIIKLFNDAEVNPSGAQLIFSTHNDSLMSPNLLRRDQIWFAEKTNGASRFFSLDDFDKKKVTPASPFARWYAEGRFGAIPSIDYQGIVKLLKKDRGHAKAKN